MDISLQHLAAFSVFGFWHSRMANYTLQQRNPIHYWHLKKEKQKLEAMPTTNTWYDNILLKSTGVVEENLTYYCCSLTETNRVPEELLTLFVRGKHAHVKCHSPHHSRTSAFPECRHSFISSNTIQGLDCIRVVPPLGNRQSCIGLHAYECQISRTANSCSNCSSSQSTESLLIKW